MIKLAKFIVTILVLILTIASLFVIYIKFILLNKNYYTYSFNKNGTYENLSRGLKGLTKEMLIDDISGTIDYDNLTLGQRQEIEVQAERYTAFINKNNVKDFTETNLSNILKYLKNRSEYLIIYLPLEKWAISKEILDQMPDYLKTTNLDAREILINLKTANENTDLLGIFESLKLTDKYLNSALFAVLTLNVIFFSLYYFLTNKEKRGSSMGKLLSFLGVIILISSWVLFTAQHIFAEGLAFKNTWNEVLLGTLVPIFINPIVLIFAMFGLVSLITGIILFNKQAGQNLPHPSAQTRQSS